MIFPLNAPPVIRFQCQKVKLEVMPVSLSDKTARMNMEKCKKLAKILDVSQKQEADDIH